MPDIVHLDITVTSREQHGVSNHQQLDYFLRQRMVPTKNTHQSYALLAICEGNQSCNAVLALCEGNPGIGHPHKGE